MLTFVFTLNDRIQMSLTNM